MCGVRKVMESCCVVFFFDLVNDGGLGKRSLTPRQLDTTCVCCYRIVTDTIAGGGGGGGGAKVSREESQIVGKFGYYCGFACMRLVLLSCLFQVELDDEQRARGTKDEGSNEKTNNLARG